MSTSSGTINSLNINAIILFCAGFTKTQIQNAENIYNGKYFYHKDILDIDQSAWRRYTSTYSEDFAEAKEKAEDLGVLFSNFSRAQGDRLVTTKHPWGAENISNIPGFHLSDFAIVPTYQDFVEAQRSAAIARDDEARQTRARATPNPQTGGKSHKKRRKSRKKRRKSRKKRRTKGRKKRKRKK